MTAGPPRARRAVIVGAGLMGRWHADAAARAGGRVIGVVDPDLHAAQRLAHRHDGAVAAADLADLAPATEADVVHLCAPLGAHVRLIEQALGMGLHVLAEKPLAPDAPETERLYGLAADAGVVLCPVHQFPFQRGVGSARLALARLGAPTVFEARFCSAGGIHAAPDGLDAIVDDVLPHPLSLLEALVPGALDETAWQIVRPRAGEMLATGTGPPATIAIMVSMSSRPTCAELTLRTTAGTVRLDLFHGYAFVQAGRVSRAHKLIGPFDRSARNLGAAGANLARRARDREFAYPGLRALVRAFYAAAAGAAPAPVDPAEAIAIARTRDLFRRAPAR